MGKKTVLVVDDSPTVRKAITLELETFGYQVVEAANGAEALSIIAWIDTLPDVITLDLNMPIMSGFEVCERLRSADNFSSERKRLAARIPIIFISASDTQAIRERGYQLEVIDFITKPFKPGDIAQGIEKVLNPPEQFIGMKALIVDDSPSLRRIIKSNLNRKGVSVVEAQDGMEALQLIEAGSHSFDMVILDQVMPGMRGDEVCRRLKTMEHMEQVPVFFISALADKDAIIALFKAGACDYLQKPFIEEELSARLVAHLRARKHINQLKMLNDSLGYQANHDSLTGLFNKRYFQEAIAGNFAQAQRYAQDLTCVLIDLDHFKRVNDDHGHIFGDQVLAEFGKLLKNRTRVSDLAARYGGEEFVLLLPNTGTEQAIHLVENIREAAESHCYTNGSALLQVTCSIGLSSIRSCGAEDYAALVVKADEALYKAKEKGRNAIVVDGGPSLVY